MGDGVVTFHESNPPRAALAQSAECPVPSAQCTVASTVDGVQRFLAHEQRANIKTILSLIRASRPAEASACDWTLRPASSFSTGGPKAQTSGLQWLAGNSHDLGRPPFPPPPFPPSTPQPRQLQLDCHRRPVIGVFRLVARSCVRGAPNEEQRRHDGSRLALNARSCQAFLHTFASPPERQDLQKIKLHRCTISPLFNGARQPQTATGIPSQSELVLSARCSPPVSSQGQQSSRAAGQQRLKPRRLEGFIQYSVLPFSLVPRIHPSLQSPLAPRPNAEENTRSAVRNRAKNRNSAAAAEVAGRLSVASPPDSVLRPPSSTSSLLLLLLPSLEASHQPPATSAKS
ncbi:hypothetical protein F5882DRAFT_435514, partial [Hyaloscypha sp. PMI_1271]